MIKRVWVDRQQKLQKGEQLKLSNIIHSTDEIIVGSDFMIYVDDNPVWCSIEEFNGHEQS